MIPAIDTIVENYPKPAGPGAAIAVVRDGQPIHVKGYGMANVEWNIPIQADTVFRLASVTKQFTTTAIMMLAEQGKLSPQDALTQYLPKYPTSGHHITLHHLMTHTSGIHSYTNVPDFIKTARQDMTPQQIAEEFGKIPFDFRPGTRYSYNNSAYILLGMIIEKVSGMSYADFIQKHIFDALGMKQSYYLHNEPIIPKRASGYDPTADGLQNSIFLSMTQPHAAGALGSTVNDLMLWDKALRENTLLSAETQALMYTPVRLEDGSQKGYGYGWGLHDYRGHQTIHHGGGIFGFSTFIARFVQDATTVIVLSNYSAMNSGRLTAAIAAQVFGLPAVERKAITLPAEQLSKYVGKYLLEEAFPVEVSLSEANGLTITLGSPIHLLPMNEREFYDAADPESTVTFSDEREGIFSHLEFHGPFSDPMIGERMIEAEG